MCTVVGVCLVAIEGLGCALQLHRKIGPGKMCPGNRKFLSVGPIFLWENGARTNFPWKYGPSSKKNARTVFLYG